ncbi:hypothetical protein ACIQU6_30445 [Streptomyces sp. NPDC090442]|uniref:COG1470 family protein n=1 Tax=Streptomyces sp. NPDC090442 TaxID=3365962 RepID=UPI003811DFAC
MSVRAELIAPEDVISPGSSLTVHLRVWNESRIVDAYRLRLLGPPADWPDTETDLGRVPVYPGNHEKINIPLTLPLDSELAPGPLTFAVHVASVEDPHAVAVPEAVVSVGEFHDIEPQLARSRVFGALWSSNLVVLENTGNATTAVRLRVAAEDEKAPLRPKLRRSRLTLKPGERARVSLGVRVVSPTFTGTTTPWEIGVRVGWEQGQECTVSYVHRQRPFLPKPALKTLIVLGTVAIAFAAVWISPLGGKKPGAQTESAKGPPQVEAVREAEKKEAEKEKKKQQQEKDAEEKAEQEKDAAGALKKKPFQTSLTADTRKNKPAAAYKVDKGYRLEIKTVQLSASGPEGATVFLAAGAQQLLTTGINNIKDYTPPAPLSLKENENLTLRVDCTATPPTGGPALTPSTGPTPSTPPPPATGCIATAVVVGQLIPLKGPNAEPDKSA